MAKAGSDEKGFDSKLDEDEIESPPSSLSSTRGRRVVVRPGYNQTYILRTPVSPDGADSAREVLFRCGNWCYAGTIDIGFPTMGLKDVPFVIPALQKQQDKLSYMCDAVAMPEGYVFTEPMAQLYDVAEFLGEELGGDKVTNSLQTGARIFKWIDEDTASTYFELQTVGNPAYEGVDLVASKTYHCGLIIIVIYFENNYYVTLQDPGDDHQPLLDVRFPDVSNHSQGYQICGYRDPDLLKLVLWNSKSFEVSTSSAFRSMRNSGGASESKAQEPVKKGESIVSPDYIQTYCVGQPPEGAVDATEREVLFRFGNWCYAGNVKLGQRVSVEDLRALFRPLRQQQNRLEFVCETRNIQPNVRFSASIKRLQTVLGHVQSVIIQAEPVLTEMVRKMPEENWLDACDNGECFFELQTTGDKTIRKDGIEVVLSKMHVADVIMTVMYYGDTYYVVVTDGGKSQPLLDRADQSPFPDVSKRGKGFQVQTFPWGTEEWPELRKISVWQIPTEEDAEEEGPHGRAEASTRAEAKESKGGDMDAKGGSHHATDAKAESKSVSPQKKAGLQSVYKPRHLRPMDGATPSLKLRDLGLGNKSGEAPWDPFGKPKLL